MDRIVAEGLPVPVKSACWFCPVTRPDEIVALEKPLLRRIVAMEARAEPRLKKIDGLWRRPTKGTRGSVARPGSMTEFIREKSLLPSKEIDDIRALVPLELTRRNADGSPCADEGELAKWSAFLDAYRSPDFNMAGLAGAYASVAT